MEISGRKMTINYPIIIISGPTATGKTSTSINIAKKLEKEFSLSSHIINFDSLLFYKELNIGTAKPSIEEQGYIPHHLIDIETINNPLSASSYRKKALEKINKLQDQNKKSPLILVGGSGFYLRALIKGMYDSNQTSPEVKSFVESKMKAEGISFFSNFLKENDPESFNNLHGNDHYRIIRAVEFFLQNKSKLSSQKKEYDESLPYDFSKNSHEKWNMLHLHLDLPKDCHWEVIQKRTKQMIQAGLTSEVKNILQKGFSKKLRPLNSIGYKETLDFIEGIYSESEYEERINISTRQLAKSQRTFFKKVTPKHEYNAIKDQDSIIKAVSQFIILK